MRLWTVHPAYLDRQGLLALWREALLAQVVLLGKTTGYRHHPQLERFRAESDPVSLIATYLAAVHAEGRRRGYRFDGARIHPRRTRRRIVETEGQLLHEWQHLKAKLRRRNADVFLQSAGIDRPLAHPLFRIVPGVKRSWER